MHLKKSLLYYLALCTILMATSCRKHYQPIASFQGALVKNKAIAKTYEQKRDFSKTNEPVSSNKKRTGKEPIFVIQKHAASHLHYDFRLEIEGTLKSWAIPKGPSLEPRTKRLAIPTEDHPLEYATFEGTIPEGEYGAGTVMVWDIGSFENIKQTPEGLTPLDKSYENGHIEVFLHGKKLKGGYTLIRLASSSYKKESWLLVKMRDEYASATNNLLDTEPNSALTGKSMEEITKESHG